MYKERGAVDGGNSSPIREFLGTIKNRLNCAMVHRRVGIKGLKSIWKNGDETFTQSIYSGTKQTHFQ
jgi:hypothetical protein